MFKHSVTGDDEKDEKQPEPKKPVITNSRNTDDLV
jgi:hypothetical protein